MFQQRENSQLGPACYAAKRIRRHLEVVTSVLLDEGLILKGIAWSRGMLCKEVREDWEEWVKNTTHHGKRVSPRLLLAFKGAKRIFDEPCGVCDPALSQGAKEEWLSKISVPLEPLDPEFRSSLKAQMRETMGSRWWLDWKGEKETIIPDQKGCLELKAGCGGTLSVPAHGKPFDISCADRSTSKCFRAMVNDLNLESVERSTEYNRVRLGCAKTKGKFRVVTMQGADVKEKLGPVHEAAYDWISSFHWCVRGQLCVEDLEPVVLDRRPGEVYISGDYAAATDSLNQDAVLAAVEVLCEALPKDLGDILLRSFRDLVVRGPRGDVSIVRGSMMGSKLSFVVLCLLNKACYNLIFSRDCERSRKVRINGDDIVFCGSETTFASWERMTSRIGLVVNREKTGMSKEYLELNSMMLDVKRMRFVRKLNFGWLLDKLQPDEAGSALFELCNLVSFRTAVRLLSKPLVRAKIENRELPLSVVPRRWFGFLVKRWWFRRVLLRDPPETKKASERVYPMAKGPLLKPEFSEILEPELAELGRACRSLWTDGERGKLFEPRKARLTQFRFCQRRDNRGKGLVVKRGPALSVRLWDAAVLDTVLGLNPNVLEPEAIRFESSRVLQTGEKMERKVVVSSGSTLRRIVLGKNPSPSFSNKFRSIIVGRHGELTKVVHCHFGALC